MSIVRALLNLFYPPRCIFCDSLLDVENAAAGDAGRAGKAAAGWEELLCRRCAAGLPWFQSRCPRCAHLLEAKDAACSFCRGVKYAFEACTALGSYQGGLRKALHRFKYYGQKSLAGPLGTLLHSKISRQPRFSAVQFLVPVPLHRQRLAQRGYNQAALLAGAVGKKLGLPVREVLKRVKETQSQTGLNKKQRRENLQGAFRCCRAFPPGSRLLLIDDVLTSGATAQEASLILKKAGAGEVSVAVLARV
ncbi:MAG: ComF family protein [Firmicutes bacterium]|nr:ComF family protein [Bacillota bacterium]